MIQINPIGYFILVFLGIIILLIIISIRIRENLLEWVLWDFSGIRFVWEKSYEKTIPPIDSETGKRPPATFIIWVSGLLGIYVALFGIASQRYESRVDIIENRASSIYAQISVPEVRKYALGRIARVQNIPCPVHPEILKPHTVWLSLFGEDDKYHQIVEDFKETVEDWKKYFSGVNLKGIDLQQAQLLEANFQGAFLVDVNFRRANLVKANLRGAYLGGADFHKANLLKADLQGAFLGGISLARKIQLGLISESIGSRVDFENDFRNARNLTPAQLSKVKTLYEASLPFELEKIMWKKYPHLFEKPEE